MDRPARLVIVEDEAVTALDISQQLRRLGYQVVAVASNGRQAITQTLAHRPDVVLMDIQLPGEMDGIDVARRIQASAPIPIIYMSANADAVTLKRIQTTNAARVILKPIHVPTLHLLLQQALSA
jgi:two-component system, cell cycle sensor histidine kinase and response regulator CckA